MADLSRVAPELRATFARVPAIDLSRRPVRTVVRLATRLVPPSRGRGVRVATVRAGSARYRLYRPDRPSGAGLLWMHGGGMVIGTPRQDERACRRLAADLGITVASVDYRLAPEHPFPAALEDSCAVWDDVVGHAAEWRIDPGRVAVGGQSAGGGLAALVAQHLADRSGVQPAAQWLVYPMLDDRTAARTDLDALAHPLWDNRNNRYGWRAFLGREPGGADVPPGAVPARRIDLAGLPPAWIGVGDVDLFLAEDTAYAERLRAAGVDVTLDVVPGAPHGFDSLCPAAPLSRDFTDRSVAWLADRLRVEVPPARR